MMYAHLENSCALLFFYKYSDFYNQQQPFFSLSHALLQPHHHISFKTAPSDFPHPYSIPHPTLIAQHPNSLCSLGGETEYLSIIHHPARPTELTKADGLNAEARVGVTGEHRGILYDHHVFRILKHWLKAGDPDPFYNPFNDYVILPTAFEMEKYKENGSQVTSLKEEWEIISND